YVEFGEFRADRSGIKKVGTFAGVFCYLVGNAGLLVTLAQFGLAYLIVFFTVTSICAICTNGAVEGGGVYCPEFGGAIGTLFFFANVVSSALCISACTEALIENFGTNGYLVGSAGGIPDSWWYQFLYRSCLNCAGLAVSLAGASLFARTSLAIWFTMLICLGSAWSDGGLRVCFWCTLHRSDGGHGGSQYERSIPFGTLAALVFTAVSYVALSALTAATCSRQLLQNNYVYLLPINMLLLVSSPRQAAPLIDFVNDQKKVRKYLLLDPRREHVKFWRPQMLLLVSSPRQAAPLIDFVNDQKKVRKYLLLDPRREHVKFWRPQMLLLVSSPRQAAPLIDFVNDQKKVRKYLLLDPRREHGGLFVLGHVKAFVELCLAQSVRSGAAHLTRLSGLGAMKPDTVLLGFRDTVQPRDWFRESTSPYKTDEFDFEGGESIFPLRRAAEPGLSASEYTRIISDVLCVNKNVCVCRHFHNLDMAAVERSSRGWQHLRLRLHTVSTPDNPIHIHGNVPAKHIHGNIPSEHIHGNIPSELSH
ncbi:putative cation chloride cotransporter, partial [Operophtera brumata]